MIELIKKKNKIIVKLVDYDRYIGIIKNRIYQKKIIDSYIMHKYSAIGINAELIMNYEHLFDKVEVSYRDKIYSLPTRDIVKYGFVKSESYFEPQIFVPLTKWKEKQNGKISTNQNN